MTWNLPPQELRDRVNRIIGGDIYAEAGARYARVLEQLGMREIPSTEAGRSWYRTPEHHFRLEGAARYSQHLLGLASDWQIRDAEMRQRVVDALRAHGFTVQLKSRQRVHAQALTPAEFARFLPALRAAGLFGERRR